jgi:hypothetical protein
VLGRADVVVDGHRVAGLRWLSGERGREEEERAADEIVAPPLAQWDAAIVMDDGIGIGPSTRRSPRVERSELTLAVR